MECKTPLSPSNTYILYRVSTIKITDIDENVRASAVALSVTTATSASHKGLHPRGLGILPVNWASGIRSGRDLRFAARAQAAVAVSCGEPLVDLALASLLESGAGFH